MICMRDWIFHCKQYLTIITSFFIFIRNGIFYHVVMSYGLKFCIVPFFLYYNNICAPLRNTIHFRF